MLNAGWLAAGGSDWAGGVGTGIGSGSGTTLGAGLGLSSVPCCVVTLNWMTTFGGAVVSCGAGAVGTLAGVSSGAGAASFGAGTAIKAGVSGFELAVGSSLAALSPVSFRPSATDSSLLAEERTGSLSTALVGFVEGSSTISAVAWGGWPSV